MSNVNSSQVDEVLKQLAPEKVSEILFKSLKDGANTLKANTVNNLRRPTLRKGVRVKPKKTTNEVQVNIMGDYRLKWFEKGTKERYTKGHKVTGHIDVRHLKRTGKGGYRGRIIAEHFFARARENDEPIFETMFTSITESLNKIIR